MSASVQFRIVDGKTGNEERVEVRHNGEWGTMAKVMMDGEAWDASFVCHALKYAKAVSHGTTTVKGSGRIWLKDIACLGKTSFDQCTHCGWGNTAGCNHGRDAEVVCGDLSAGTTT